MNVIIKSANYNRLTLHFITNTSHIAMHFIFYFFNNEWLTVFGTERNMEVIFDQGLSHKFIKKVIYACRFGEGLHPSLLYAALSGLGSDHQP